MIVLCMPGSKNEALELRLDRGQENAVPPSRDQTWSRRQYKNGQTALHSPTQLATRSMQWTNLPPKNRNFCIRERWVIPIYPQRMRFFQKHSLMEILANPFVKDFPSARPTSLGHNRNDVLPAGQSVLFRWLSSNCMCHALESLNHSWVRPIIEKGNGENTFVRHENPCLIWFLPIQWTHTSLYIIFYSY